MYEIKTQKNSNPLLNKILITNSAQHLKAEIFPNLGATLQKLSYGETEIIDGITTDEAGLAAYKVLYNSSFLFPFPSRIPSGTYDFNNKEYSLDCNEKKLNNAIHGLVYNKSFSIKEEKISPESASLTLLHEYRKTDQGYPFDFDLEITYTFYKSNLEIGFKIQNTGSEPLPFGFGWHPYLKSENINESELDFKANQQVLFNEFMVPDQVKEVNIDKAFNIGTANFDNCYKLTEEGFTFDNEHYKTQFSFNGQSPDSYLQIYIPPSRKSIALEPMTCYGNSFNSKISLLSLNPNEVHDIKVVLENSIK